MSPVPPWATVAVVPPAGVCPYAATSEAAVPFAALVILLPPMSTADSDFRVTGQPMTTTLRELDAGAVANPSVTTLVLVRVTSQSYSTKVDAS